VFEEFKAFIARGNVLDLAVAVVIGAAFGGIVSSFTGDLLMPLIAALFGQPDFSNLFIRLGPVPAGVDAADYAALKAAGVPMFGWGAFLTALINFLIVAAALFFVVKAANAATRRREEVPPPSEPSEEVLLLREIRDGLQGR
jgi:large conductance mechanosensitive channel